MAFIVDFDAGKSVSTLDAIEKKLEAIGAKATEASSKMKGVVKATDSAAPSAAKLKNEVNGLAGATDKAGDKTKKTKEEIDELRKASNAAAQRAAALRASLNAAGTHMGIFTGQTILTAAAVFSVVSALKAMVTVGITFTSEMARAQAIMGSTGENSAMLEKEVRRLGESTIFTASEVATGMTALAMAGLSAAQAFEALEPSLALAQIGMIDMYKSADIVTNVMNGFRLQASDIPAIVDDLASAITSSNATIEQMATALSYVAPIAQAAGAEIGEVVAMLEVFHNAGIKGSRAGTSLRRAYSNLLAPSTEAKEVLNRLGIATQDTNGYMLEMSDIMKQLADNGAVTADVIALFGVRAAPAMSALLADLKGTSSEFEKFRTILANNEGAAKNFQETMDKALGKDLLKLVSAIQEKAVSVFKHLEADLIGAAQGAVKFVQAISPESIKNLAESLRLVGRGIAEVADFAILAGKVWLAYKAFQAVTMSVKALTTAYKFMIGVDIAGSIAALIPMLGHYVLGVGAATTATRVFGVTVAAVAAPLTIIAALLGTAYLVYDHYSDSAEEAAKSNDKLTESEKRLIAVKEAAQRLADDSVLYANAGVTGSGDKIVDRIEKELADISLKREQIRMSMDLLTAKLGAEKDGISQPTYIKAMKQLVNSYNDTAENIKEKAAELSTYLTTGFDAQGTERLKAFNREMKDLAAIKFNDEASKILKGLTTSLGQLSTLAGNNKITAAEALIGSESLIEARTKQVEDAYNKRLKPLQEQFEKFDPNKRGKFADPTQALDVQRQIDVLNKDLENSENSLTQARTEASGAFDAYVKTSLEAVEAGMSTAEVLQSEIDKLNGVAEASKTASDLKLEQALITNRLNQDVLRGVAGREQELIQLQLIENRLVNQIGAINALRIAKERAKSDKSARDEETAAYDRFVKSVDSSIESGLRSVEVLKSEISALKDVGLAAKTAADAKLEALLIENKLEQLRIGSTPGKERELIELQMQEQQLRDVIEQLKQYRQEKANEVKVKKDEDDLTKLTGEFNQGKGLSDRLKAEQAYAQGRLQLDEYVKAGLITNEQDYTESLKQLSMERTEAQNKEWFNVAQNMSKAVGDNIAKAITMQQTWSETSKNIRQSIVGGIVGALIQKGTQMAANALLHSIFGKKEESEDAALTISSIANSQARTNAKMQEVGASASQAVLNQGNGDPYSAFFRMAAMTALVAAVPPLVTSLFGGTREIGGPVTAGQSYLVGERGAEVFTPTTSGAITSNADVKRSLNKDSGTGEVNHYYAGDTYNISATDADSFRRMLKAESGYLNQLNKRQDRRRPTSR